MKIEGQDRAAFVMVSGQAAIARHAKPTDKCEPVVQIVSIGLGVSVVGVEALEALRLAIDYALKGKQ